MATSAATTSPACRLSATCTPLSRWAPASPWNRGSRAPAAASKGSLAVIGDSTFLHSGLTGLLNAVHQRTNVTVLIQDNRITAMTGGQTNPGNEQTLAGVETKPVDLAAICQRPRGRAHRRSSTPTTTKRASTALKAGLAYDGPAVLITNRPCVLFPRKLGADGVFAVDEELCNACQQCMKLGCPSLHHTDAVYKSRHKVEIDASTCTGCSLCAQLCKTGRDRKAGEA